MEEGQRDTGRYILITAGAITNTDLEIENRGGGIRGRGRGLSRCRLALPVLGDWAGKDRRRGNISRLCCVPV